MHPPGERRVRKARQLPVGRERWPRRSASSPCRLDSRLQNPLALAEEQLRYSQWIPSALFGSSLVSQICSNVSRTAMGARPFGMCCPDLASGSNFRSLHDRANRGKLFGQIEQGILIPLLDA